MLYIFGKLSIWEFQNSGWKSIFDIPWSVRFFGDTSGQDPNLHLALCLKFAEGVSLTQLQLNLGPIKMTYRFSQKSNFPTSHFLIQVASTTEICTLESISKVHAKRPIWEEGKRQRRKIQNWNISIVQLLTHIPPYFRRHNLSDTVSCRTDDLQILFSDSGSRISSFRFS